MKLLVTGGAGFIGSNFVHHAVASNDFESITVIDALTYAGSLNNLEGVLSEVQFIEGNILDASLVDGLVAESDAVVHFAAETHNDNSLLDPGLFFQTNTLGTLNIASSCAKHQVRMHHVSTDEVFGDLELKSKQKFDLNSPYRPSSPYSASKAASDHLVRAWTRSFQLEATISNCSNNYGPRQHWEKLIPQTIARFHNGQKARIYGSGENIRDWISAEDHSEAVLRILKVGKSGSTYLISAHDEKSNLEVISLIASIMGKTSADFEFVTDRPGHDERYALDASSTYSELDWRPLMTLETSMWKMVEWYQQRLESV